MPKQLWPNEIADILVSHIFGEKNVTAPVSFATARGLSYFVAQCGDHPKAGAVRNYLVENNIFPRFLIKTEYSYAQTSANYGKLQFHIPKILAEQAVTGLVAAADEIKKILSKEETIPYATYRDSLNNPPTAKAEPVRPREPVYSDIYGSFVSNEPTFIPEISAFLDYAYKMDATLETIPAEYWRWLIPPQGPARAMFYMNAEGKMDLATGDVQKKLIAKYNETVAERRALITDKDTMFNPATKKIVSLPAGAVHQLISNGCYQNLGPATYWNPQTKQHHVLTEREIETIKNKPNLVQEFSALKL